MPKTDFDEFVKRQQAEKEAVASIDWDSQRDDWLNYLDALYAQIESFLEAYVSAGQAQCKYREIPLNEENIGSYTARQLILKIGRQEITFTPVGTLLIGTKGQVDVLGSAGTSRFVLLDKKATNARSLVKVTVSVVGKGKTRLSPPPENQPREPIEWVWKIISRPPEMRFIDLTQDAFFEMILEVANA
jgi:hypothetical protein